SLPHTSTLFPYTTLFRSYPAFGSVEVSGSAEIFDHHNVAAAAIHLAIEQRAAVRRNGQARQVSLRPVREARDFADLFIGKAVKLQHRSRRARRREVDSLLRHAPVTPEAGLMMIGYKLFFAARSRHPPQPRQRAAFRIVKGFAVERFKAFKAAMLGDLHGLPS